MASYIKTLKEDNGDITYPQTLASAVYTTGGTDVESALSAKASTTDLAGKIDIGDVQSTDIVANAVTTAKIADSAVTTAKIADGAITRAKVDATSYSATAEGNWAVSYLPNGKKMWIQSGNWGPSGSFTPGGQNYAFVSNIATLPASLADFSGIHIIGTAQSATPSCQCDFVWGSTFVGGTTKFGLRLHEWYGTGSVTRSGTFSLVLIEK